MTFKPLINGIATPPILTETKRCSRCKEEKPLDEFHHNCSQNDGYAHYCKECACAYQREYATRPHVQARLDKYYQSDAFKESQRRYQQSKKGRKFQRERRQRIKQKKKAQNAVYRAIQSGELVRPERCEKCGAQERLEAHHYKGYSDENVLDVQFLCISCHNKAHKEEDK